MPEQVCKRCGGSGVVPVPSEFGPPVVKQCTCVLHKRILANVERGMSGLTRAQVFPKGFESPLKGRTEESMWLTATRPTFMAHMRWVAIRKPPLWGFQVVSDADLMTAWLATTAIQGKEIFDADAMQASTNYLTLMDLAVPPTLLVIYLGVKAARNVAMPEVLLETIQHRDHEGKPTWLVDQPTHPITTSDHLGYSEYLGEVLNVWKEEGRHLTLKMDEGAQAQVKPTAPKTNGGGRRTLSQGSGSTSSVQTRTRKAPARGKKK